MADATSSAVQDYLKAIHSLGGAQDLVAPADIATAMGVKAPSVTGMLKRLDESGWIHYTPGSGAKLTTAGVSEARRVIRRHRLLELFLTQVLGLDWSEVDSEAEALEHAISPRLEAAIAEHLGEPLEDPHGHPIPSVNGEMPARNFQRLNEFRGGQDVLIREAQDDSPDRLRRWQQLGLVPGARIRIISFEPLDDLFEIQVADRIVRLGTDGLSGLRGELTSPTDERGSCARLSGVSSSSVLRPAPWHSSAYRYHLWF